MSDDKTPAEFFAGWYYGLSGHDKRDKIIDCYEPDDKITGLLNQSMQDLQKSDPEFDTKINKVAKLMEKALDDCHQLDYHMFDKW